MATRIADFLPGKDDEEVLALRAEVWGKDHPHTSKAFYAWLFSGAASGILVRRDSKLVCFAGLVPRLARRAGAVIKVAHGLDFMASPSLQGLSGLYAFKLVKAWLDHAARAGYDFAACFPNDQSIRLLISDKLHWKIVASPRLFVLPLPSIRFDEPPIKHLPKSMATIGGRVLATTLSITRSRPLLDCSVTSLDLAVDANALDALWQHADRGKIEFSREARVMQWRYCLNPVYRYRILVRRNQGQISGFVVTTRRNVMGLESDLILDGLWDEGDLETPRVLLSAVEFRARQEGTGIVAGLALPDTPFQRELIQFGFLLVPARLDPKPFHLVGYPLTEAGEKCMNAAAWNLTWGDMDVV
jgi:hypothetical protein